ncbi:hypothetical protein PAMC26510_30340 [Caballeronia sordidicola]|uniref:Uncharacterized protein n=1 Tax=Caballeronia sordidicola TaxID=196367 RepID=A0A242M8U8_CABSO|nr:hypothetical protein PAMC26510_30340 [Caballeronia sordidicola]
MAPLRRKLTGAFTPKTPWRHYAENEMAPIRRKFTPKALQEEVIETGFDPDDPASVQAAIAYVEAKVDAKVAPYRGNRLVEEAADQIKAECRANILAQVEAHTGRGSRTLH